MRNGFTLIEIMFSLVIGGLLAAALMATITQVGDVRGAVSDITSAYGRASLFQQQMERDVMGAFVPTQYDLLPTQTDKKEEQPKRLAHIFTGSSTADGNRLDSLTFITCNPLEVYVGIKKAKLKPRVARVVYRLVPDKKRKNAYMLLRQEGTSRLSYDAYKPDVGGENRAFTMVDGIQNLKVQFISVEEKKEDTAFTYTYKRQANWKAIDEKEQQKQKQDKTPARPRLPHYVSFKLWLWNSTFDESRLFTMTIPIASQSGQFEQPQQEKSQSTKTDQTASAVQSPTKPGST